jgi:hypothetical protein
MLIKISIAYKGRECANSFSFYIFYFIYYYDNKRQNGQIVADLFLTEFDSD